MKRLFALSLTTAAFAATTAAAAYDATATTDLHLRAGPGPNYPIMSVIGANDPVSVEGCIEQANWCKVTYAGAQGWAYGDYLTASLKGETVAVYPNRVELETVVIKDELAHEEGALAVGSMGAMIGAAAIGGPAAIVVGAIIGSAVGVSITPEEQAVTFIRENPVEPVVVNGEIIVGANVPEVVDVYAVPEFDLTYTNLNGRYVVVDKNTRQIVYIADF